MNHVIDAERERFLLEMFSAVDRQDIDAYGRHLSSNVSFVFANADPVTGREQVQQAVSAFYESISSVRHEIHALWPGTEGGAVESTVTYQRLDGGTVSVPAVTICRFNEENLVCDYRIFVDLAPLFAAQAPSQ